MPNFWSRVNPRALNMRDTELGLRSAQARRQHWLDEREAAHIAHDPNRESHADAVIKQCEDLIVALEQQWSAHALR
jgi:hypothetical protein